MSSLFNNKSLTFTVNGGERGIRTLETVSRLHAFQACAFNHSATSPLKIVILLYNKNVQLKFIMV